MPRFSTQYVQGGWLDGHAVRIARKPHRCDGYEQNIENPTHKGERCKRTIEAGDAFVEGELNPDRAGGFGTDRYCGHCYSAGYEASLAVMRVNNGLVDPA